MQIRKRFENDSIRPRTFLMNVLIGARNGDSRHDSAPPVVDLTLVTIISFPCQFCAPDVAHILAVHLPAHYDLTSASRALQRPIREYGLDRGDSPRFENDSNLRAQIHCENIAKVRFARQFAAFDYFLHF